MNAFKTFIALLIATLGLGFASFASAQSASTGGTELAKPWVGKWLDQTGDASHALLIESNGNISFEKMSYAWVGSRQNLPKKAGCYAFYDGTLTKASISEKIAPDHASTNVLKKVSDDNFRRLQLQCVDTKLANAAEECQSIGMFFDQGTVYRALTCQIGSNKHLMVYPFKKS